MAAVPTTVDQVKGIFKTVYKDKIIDVISGQFVIQEYMKKGDDASMADGLEMSFPVALTNENGVTLCGEDEILDFNDAKSMSIKSATVKSSEMWLSSQIGTQAMARAASKGPQAVAQATSTIVAQNLRSHAKTREFLALYGRDIDVGLGNVSYLTGDFRGVAFVNGSGTIGGTVFTNGVNVAEKKILLEPATISTGALSGAKGLEIEVVVGGAVVASGAIVSVNARLGIVEVDFAVAGIAAGASGDTALLLQGQLQERDFIGAAKILKTVSGNLFGISATEYDMWRGSNAQITGKLTFDKLIVELAELVDMGLMGEVTVFVPVDSWATLLNDQMSLRHIDASYKPEKIQNGAKAIEFFFHNGLVKIVASPFVRRGDCFIMEDGAWSLLGAAKDISLKVPGSNGEDLIIKPDSGNYYKFHSYSNSCVFCSVPRRSKLLFGIDPESAT